MANNFKNYALSAVGTSPTTLYTAGAGVQSTIIGLTVANILPGTTITANVIVNISGSNYYMVKAASIDPGNSLVPIGGDQKLVLEAGDYISISTSNASSADVIMSLLEIS